MPGSVESGAPFVPPWTPTTHVVTGRGSGNIRSREPPGAPVATRGGELRARRGDSGSLPPVPGPDDSTGSAEYLSEPTERRWVRGLPPEPPSRASLAPAAAAPAFAEAEARRRVKNAKTLQQLSDATRNAAKASPQTAQGLHWPALPLYHFLFFFLGTTVIARSSCQDGYANLCSPGRSHSKHVHI